MAGGWFAWPGMAVACVFAVVSSPAFAVDSPDEAEADLILVVGQKQAPISIAPRGLSVSLGADQFAGVNAVNVEDLIKYAPDFFVRKRFAGDNNGVPGFRGTHSVQSARALVMVDGFVVSNFLGNSFSFPPSWGVVGPAEVRQFDVVYGPYSARYPGNSMGGIVNITTRAPTRTEAFANVQAMLQPYDQYGTHENLWGGSVEAGFALRQKDGPFSLRLSARRLRNQGQPMQYYQLTPYSGPAAPIPVTGAVTDRELITRQPVFADYAPVNSTQDQLRAQVGFESGAVQAQLLLVGWRNRERLLHPDSYLRDADGAVVHEGIVSIDGAAYRATGSNLGLNGRGQWLAGFRLSAPLIGWDMRMNLSTLQFARQDARLSDGYANGLNNGPGRLTEQKAAGWYTADVAAEREMGAHRLAIGINANHYFTDQANFRTDHWRNADARALVSRPSGKTRAIGLFAEDEVALSGALTVTAGLRADFWRAYDGGLAGPLSVTRYAARRDSAVSPSLSARYAIAADWTAELSLAAATRFPTVGELFQGSLNGDGSFNPDSFDPALKPERSHDANFILRRRAGPVTLTGSLFYQRVRDAIFSYAGFNASGVVNNAYKNIDRTRQVGAELIVEARDWPLAGLDVDANAAWIDAETQRNRGDPATEGVQFPRIPRWRLNASLRYAVTPDVRASLGARYASRPNTDLRGELRGDTYGYTSELFALDARVSWSVGGGVTLSAGVDNITNDRAWVFHPYPQRSFLLEAGWRL